MPTFAAKGKSLRGTRTGSLTCDCDTRVTRSRYIATHVRRQSPVDAILLREPTSFPIVLQCARVIRLAILLSKGNRSGDAFGRQLTTGGGMRGQ